MIPARVVRPRCEDCGTGTNLHPYRQSDEDYDPRQYGGYNWLCGDCAYKRDHPDALPVQKDRSKWKQEETLFDDA